MLFVEGDDDFRLLRRFARRLGLQELAAGSGIIALPSGGFGSWQRVTTLAAGIADALGTSLLIAAVYDRDYFGLEEITAVVAELSKHLKLAHVHERKEIESYLLIPNVLERALRRAADERAARRGCPTPTIPSIVALLNDITEPMRAYVMSQIVAKRAVYLRSSGHDFASIHQNTLIWFEEIWANLDRRLAIVPGKEVLRLLKSHLQETFGVSLTDARIIDAMHRDDLPSDLQKLLQGLDTFRTSVP